MTTKERIKHEARDLMFFGVKLMIVTWAWESTAPGLDFGTKCYLILLSALLLCVNEQTTHTRTLVELRRQDQRAVTTRFTIDDRTHRDVQNDFYPPDAGHE